MASRAVCVYVFLLLAWTVIVGAAYCLLDASETSWSKSLGVYSLATILAALCYELVESVPCLKAVKDGFFPGVKFVVAHLFFTDAEEDLAMISSYLHFKRAAMKAVKKHNAYDEFARIRTVKGHLLPPTCNHKEEGEAGCPVCHFEEDLQLPSLPEMIFDQNLLEIRVPPTAERPLISFNAFDALRLVDHSQLPNVMVNASEKWQRANGHALPQISSPFDWTFTSEYGGTVGEWVRVEETSQRIKLDGVFVQQLMRDDPLLFSDAIQLYEDDLAGNGACRMDVKVRAMPTNFMVLCRFYVRLENLVVRVHDCCLYSQKGWKYVLREKVLRQKNIGEMSAKTRQLIPDAGRISKFLDVKKETADKLYFA